MAENLKATINSQNKTKFTISKIKADKYFTDLLLILLWITLGVILRFTNLDLKPASSIEIATIGYSLGHGFNGIPLDQIMPLETLLSPLRLDSSIGYPEIFHRLATESTHPPFYFWLTNWWINLWVENGNLVSLQVARSLSAVFGVLSIPAIFSLGWISFRSRLTGHLAALLMATSPYGIYLAQEARHYTLSVLWVIASLICLIKAVQLIEQKTSLPLGLSLSWIVINALGVATHYFFVLTLAAEAIALAVFWFYSEGNREENFSFKAMFTVSFKASFKYWRGLYLVGFGSLAGCLVWLPLVTGISDNELTSWIDTSYKLSEVWQPIPRLWGWLITMVMLLPIEGVSIPMVVISVLVILIVLIWVIPVLIRGWRSQWVMSQFQLPLMIFGSYLLGSIAIFLLVIYGLQKDISLAARYHFVYFPSLILLIGVTLSSCWQGKISAFSNQISTKKLVKKALVKSNFYPAKSQKAVVMLLVMGLLGSITVISDYGFQKSRHSDALAAHIQETSIPEISALPALVAMSHQTHSELRELVGLAFSFQRLSLQNESSPKSLTSQFPRFLLVSLNQNKTGIAQPDLSLTLAAQSKPFNLFGVNLQADEAVLQKLGCMRDIKVDLANSGYSDRFYRCQSEPSGV